MGGRKIPDDLENPVDLLMVDFTEKIDGIYTHMNLTPNDLTSISLILAVTGIAIYLNGYYVAGALLYFISYYFDCADGNYARKFNMVTKFGDYFDHTSDVFKFLLFIFVVLISGTTPMIKFTILVVVAVLVFLAVSHLGCQEMVYDKDESKSLSGLKNLCPNIEAIQYTKYCGVGTLQLTMFIILIVLPYL